MKRCSRECGKAGRDFGQSLKSASDKSQPDRRIHPQQARLRGASRLPPTLTRRLFKRSLTGAQLVVVERYWKIAATVEDSGDNHGLGVGSIEDHARPNRPAKDARRDLVTYSAHAGMRGEEHAELAIALATQALASTAGVNSVLILSPYRSQANYVLSGLKREHCGMASRVRVGTVHRAQGDEADVAIVTIDHVPDQPSPFMRATLPTHVGPWMLNVAFNRTKERLFVIAPLTALYASDQVGGAIRSAIGGLLEHARTFSVHDALQRPRHGSVNAMVLP